MAYSTSALRARGVASSATDFDRYIDNRTRSDGIYHSSRSEAGCHFSKNWSTLRRRPSDADTPTATMVSRQMSKSADPREEDRDQPLFDPPELARSRRAKVAWDVVKASGDEKLEDLMRPAFLTRSGPLMLHRVAYNDGEPTGLGTIVDVYAGGTIPPGHAVSRSGKMWAPSRAESKGERGRGRPPQQYRTPREETAGAIRAWKRVWRYVRQEVDGKQTPVWLGMPPAVSVCALVRRGRRFVQIACRVFETGDDARKRGRALQKMLESVPPAAPDVKIALARVAKPPRSDDAAAWTDEFVLSGPEATDRSEIASTVATEIIPERGRLVRVWATGSRGTREYLVQTTVEPRSQAADRRRAADKLLFEVPSDAVGVRFAVTSTRGTSWQTPMWSETFPLTRSEERSAELDQISATAALQVAAHLPRADRSQVDAYPLALAAHLLRKGHGDLEELGRVEDVARYLRQKLPDELGGGRDAVAAVAGFLRVARQQIELAGR